PDPPGRAFAGALGVHALRPLPGPWPNGFTHSRLRPLATARGKTGLRASPAFVAPRRRRSAVWLCRVVSGNLAAILNFSGRAMSETNKLRSPQQANCRDCSLAPLCLRLSLNMEDIHALDEIVKRGRPLKKGEFLFRHGDEFGSVLAVRSHSLKPFRVTDRAHEQVPSAHLPSEPVGLSGMDTELYPVSAQALETTSVCESPFERLDELSVQLPQLRRQLMRVMSREIRDDQQMMLLLSKKTADE